MKFTVKREHLLPLLTRVNSIVENKSTQKIRTHVLLSADGDNLSLVGFDNDIKISGTVAVQVEQPGATTVMSLKLFEIIRSLPAAAEIEIQLQDNTLHVICGQSRFHLATIEAEEFPLPDAYTFEKQLSLPAHEVVNLLNLVKFSMASNDVRHYLNGLLLHFHQADLTAVSTDGHRLSVADIPNTFGINEEKVIIPRKAVAEVISWLSTLEKNVEINLSQTHIQFTAGSTEMTSTLINAEYPAYETVIPEPAEQLIIIPKEPLKQALSRAKILSSEYGVGVSLTFSPWKLNLTAKNMENESVEDSIDINYDGESIKTAFNINYLQDILNVIDNDNITFSLRDSQSSCLIYDANKENARYIVMPMNI
ncbi:MAG: DNA polymerase III subunit beta [Gammaproteobacteria bacterium]|nr:MAG: DNA polymerase III subunit beta [Gammaproteobacteria bacterium]